MNVTSLYLLFAYMVGSIPTGFWLVKNLRGVDLRTVGSGSTGATNVKRVMGGKWALLVLVLDFIKGVLPVVIARLWIQPDIPCFAGQPPGVRWLPVFAALAVILGHSRSIFINFTGGKSAATGLGALVGLNPVAGLIMGSVAFVTVKLTRYVSVGSLLAAVINPLCLFWLNSSVPVMVFGLASSAYVIYLHRSNIQRLLAGTENRI